MKSVKVMLWCLVMVLGKFSYTHAGELPSIYESAIPIEIIRQVEQMQLNNSSSILRDSTTPPLLALNQEIREKLIDQYKASLPQALIGSSITPVNVENTELSQCDLSESFPSGLIDGQYLNGITRIFDCNNIGLVILKEQKRGIVLFSELVNHYVKDIPARKSVYESTSPEINRVVSIFWIDTDRSVLLQVSILNELSEALAEALAIDIASASATLQPAILTPP